MANPAAHSVARTASWTRADSVPSEDSVPLEDMVRKCRMLAGSNGGDRADYAEEKAESPGLGRHAGCRAAADAVAVSRGLGLFPAVANCSLVSAALAAGFRQQR